MRLKHFNLRQSSINVSERRKKVTKFPEEKEEESEKVGLKLNIQKTKVMASGPITSCRIDGEIMQTVRDFIFLGSKITADGDCSHEIKRCRLPGRNAMTNLDSVLKAKTLLCQQRSVQSKLWF